MSAAAHLAVTLLLAVAVVVALICCLGLVLMRDFYERLHYMAPVSTIAMFCVLAAVVVQEGPGQATLKTIVIALILLFMNATLTHVTARADRVRKLGHWTADPKENIPGARPGHARSERKR